MITQVSNDEALAAIFKALSDPTRLRIIERLACCEMEIDGTGDCRPAGSLSVGEVCCRFEQTLPTISRHLKELRQAGLVRTEKRGRWLYCSLEPEALELVRQFVDRLQPGSMGGVDTETCCR